MKRDIELTDECVVHGSLGMTRGSVLRIEDGQDMTIYAWEGGLWLTQEGDRRDRYLGPGDASGPARRRHARPGHRAQHGVDRALGPSLRASP